MMNIGWVKSASSVKGQDPLGVRSPSEFIYASLLPGITNVTDRARYFSFYTWLIWAIKEHDDKLKNLLLYEKIRRADCLYTMIAANHSLREDDNNLHGALIGSITLTSVVREMRKTGDSVQISDYTDMESTNDRYFQNRLGGLGQYYLGVLREAEFLVGNFTDGIGYTEEKGLKLAQTFDREVESDKFFSILEVDEVTVDDLDDLEWFCPCYLGISTNEGELLTDFFFNKNDFYTDNQNNRRNTLLLLLNLISNLPASNWAVENKRECNQAFLSCAYSLALPDASPWKFTQTELNETLLCWQQYYANELLSFSLQSLFRAGLDELTLADVSIQNSRAYGNWFIKYFAQSIENFEGKTFDDCVREAKEKLPPLANWHEEGHEVVISRKIYDLWYEAARDYDQIVSLLMNLLFALGARWTTEDFVFKVQLPQAYIENYPINFFAFTKKCKADWQTMHIPEWLASLVSKWGIDVHLKIALRKLRFESLDTFKIIPSETGLLVADPQLQLPPSFTSPRLSQAIQVLYDLKLVEFDEEAQSLKLSIYGDAYWRLEIG